MGEKQRVRKLPEIISVLNAKDERLWTDDEIMEAYAAACESHGLYSGLAAVEEKMMGKPLPDTWEQLGFSDGIRNSIFPLVLEVFKRRVNASRAENNSTGSNLPARQDGPKRQVN